jgi:hypothetical protein
MDERISPPVILVKTWVTLINSKESEDVRSHASNMLMQAFDHDLQGVVEFCKLNNISIK